MDPAALDAWTRSALGYAFADPAVLAEALGPTNGKLALVGTAALRALRAADAFAAHADARALAAAVDAAAGLPALALLGRALNVHRRASAASDDAGVAQATAALLGAIALDGGEPALRRALARAGATPDAADAPPPRVEPPSPAPAPTISAAPPRPAPTATAAPPRPAPTARPATAAPPKFSAPPPPAPAWATGEILDAEEEPAGPPARPSRPAPTPPAPAKPSTPAKPSAPAQATPPAGPTAWLPAGDPGAPPPPASFRKITREGAMNQARSTLADAVAAAFGGGAPSAAEPSASSAPGAYVAEAEPPDPTRPAAVLRLAAWLTAETGDPTAAPAWNDAELGGWGYGSPTAYWRSRVMLPMGFSFTGEGGSLEEAREKAAAQACRHLGVP
jgi:hypothetical protein